MDNNKNGTNQQLSEERVREIVREEIAAATTAIIEDELLMLEVRKRRAEARITDQEALQQILTALEAQRCLLQSSLRRQE